MLVGDLMEERYRKFDPEFPGFYADDLGSLNTEKIKQDISIYDPEV